MKGSLSSVTLVQFYADDASFSKLHRLQDLQNSRSSRNLELARKAAAAIPKPGKRAKVERVLGNLLNHELRL